MRGVIAAAARSPRLLPLTNNTPVSLLKVGGRAILDHQLEALQQAGIDDTLVITGFCADQVEDFCHCRASCVFNPFHEVCNVAMNLWTVRHALDPGFVLLYSDIMFETELIRELLATEGSIVLAVAPNGLDQEAEKVSLLDGMVTDIGKKVAEPYGEFIGVARFSRGALPALTEELENVARNDLAATFPKLIQRLARSGQRVTVHSSHRRWADIDFPGDLEEARKVWG